MLLWALREYIVIYFFILVRSLLDHMGDSAEGVHNTMKLYAKHAKFSGHNTFLVKPFYAKLYCVVSGKLTPNGLSYACARTGSRVELLK